MRVVKSGDKKAEAAKAALTREARIDKADECRASRRLKAAEIIRDSGLGDQLSRVNNSRAKVTPHLQQARVIYAKTVYGQELTPTFLRSAIDAYFKSVDEMPTTFITPGGKQIDLAKRRPYLIEGLCDSIGVDKSLFMRWVHDESYKELHTFARMAAQKIAARLLDLGLMKEADSALAKFYLKNITDLKECMGDKEGVKIGNVTFMTVGSREEFKRLKELDNAIDIEATDASVQGDDQPAV
jgi:hypothetical protein